MIFVYEFMTETLSVGLSASAGDTDYCWDSPVKW